MGKFDLTLQKACKEAPKPRSEKDDDDKGSRPVSWHDKHSDKKKPSGDCD